MKKTIFSMALIIIVGLFSQNSFGQEQEEIDQQALEKERVEIAEIVNNREDMIFDPFNLQKVCQSLIEMAQQNQNEEHIMSASSEEVYSNNTNDFNMFKGTIWSFSFNIGTTTFEDTIIFNDDVFVDDGEMSLPFMIEYDGYEAIGDMAYILSGGEEYTLKGVSQPLYFAYSQGKNLEQCYIFNRVNDNSVKGYYLFRHPFTSEFIDPISFKGVKQPSKPNGVDNDGDGYSENQGDCNDNDNTTYPGAIEICGDGIDQDCNGSDLSCLNEEPPSAPKGVTASDGTLSGMVQVSWNPSAGATSYDVYRADIPAWAGGVPKRIATSVVGTSYDDASAASGKQYYYWVKSKNAGGGSGYSMFDPGYWGARGYVPSVPNNAAASDGTVSDMVTVTWAPVPNSVVYEIYRADYPAYLGGNIRNIGTSTTTSYNDTTVVNGNQYYYWVKARNSWGVSGYSKFDTGYIGASSPLLPAPTGVAATDGGSGKVTLTWNAVSGALIYEVYRASKPAYEGGVPTLMGTVKNPTLIYNDAAIASGPTYYYWVKARNSWGSSGYSKFDTGYCTGP